VTRIVRSTRTWTTLAFAIGVGLAVAAIARSVAGASCPAHDPVGTTSCVDLVGSLAARVGVACAVAVVFMEALSTGLLRTWTAMERQRDRLGDGAI
jgi:hypothetical protein